MGRGRTQLKETSLNGRMWVHLLSLKLPSPQQFAMKTNGRGVQKEWGSPAPPVELVHGSPLRSSFWMWRWRPLLAASPTHLSTR